MSITPALADLEPLVGYWRMELYNAAFLPEPDSRIRGRSRSTGSRMTPRCGYAKAIRSIPPLRSGLLGVTKANPGMRCYMRTTAVCHASIE